MPSFIDRLKKRIWKTSLDDKQRQEVYQQLEDSSSQLVALGELLSEKVKSRHIKKIIKKELAEQLEQVGVSLKKDQK